MKRYFASAMALIVIVNLVLLARVVYNRQGDAPTSVVLTERELRLPWDYGALNEESGLSFQLNWNRRLPQKECTTEHSDSCYNHSLPLTPLLAEQLGFELPESMEPDQTHRPYRREPPRQVWLALEMEGAAYQGYLDHLEQQIAWAKNTSLCSSEQEITAGCDPNAEESADRMRVDQKRVDRSEEDLRHAKRRESRLFVVDMARSRQMLLSRYADHSNVAVLSGMIRISASKEGRYSVSVQAIFPSQIYVPLQFRQQLVGLDSYYPHQNDCFVPRYEASIAIGKLGEPWVEALSLLK
jgi:hypothetical protein